MEQTKMKVLFFDSDIISCDNFIWGMLENGIYVSKSQIKVKIKTVDFDQVELIKKESKEYDFVATQNFSRTVAEGCHCSGVPYFSWIWDSPQAQLFYKEALYDTNKIFAFDKKQVERLRMFGLKNVWWLPLCANVSKASLISISDKEVKTLSQDISFVGSLYKKDKYTNVFSQLPNDMKNELEDVIENHAVLWNRESNRIYNKLSKRTSDFIVDNMPKDDLVDSKIDWRYMMETLLLSYELCHRDRVRILNGLCSNFHVTLFTADSFDDLSELLPQIKVLPRLNVEEAYKVYYSTKINLNITAPGIETGIPLRVFDIMSVGGCVFSNYQQEIEDIFEIDKDIVVFTNLDELKEKVDYYLHHEKKRIAVGISGYKKVRDEYNVKNAVKRMISLSGVF